MKSETEEDKRDDLQILPNYNTEDFMSPRIEEVTVELRVVARELHVSRNHLRQLLNAYGFNIENKLKVRLTQSHLEIIANDYIKQLRKTLKRYCSLPDQPKKKRIGDIFEMLFCEGDEADNTFTYLSHKGQVGKIDFERVKQEFIKNLLFSKPLKTKRNDFIFRLRKFAFKIIFSFSIAKDFIRHKISPNLFHVFIDEEDVKSIYATALSYSYIYSSPRVVCLNNFKTSTKNGKNRNINWKNIKM